jgi:phosphopantothenoylcysteine decarboxylase/phosphopantothenate--cysteine ligase
VLAAPAMNVRMWLHAATQRNLAQLKKDGMLFIGPDEGEMACGEFGPGRMAEPSAIADAIEEALKSAAPQQVSNVHQSPKQKGALAGKHVLVTSGPTHEPIDPVRFIANRSSGKQGHAIARAAALAGAKVTLVTGPVSIPDPDGVTTLHVETADAMLKAVENALPSDIAIFCAAVADFKVANASGQKIKKKGDASPSITLTQNPDILATIANQKKSRPALVIGFAAETQNVVKFAQYKLKRKGCDLIVANDVGAGTGVMGGDKNRVHIVAPDRVEDWPELTKTEVAERLIALAAARLAKKAAQ